MVIIITGPSHVGKTYLSQKLLEKYKYPYLSIDHLKMGLIRSKNTTLTPLSEDEKLTSYLWPVTSEIIKTAVENNQNLIVEGCYVPLDWESSFTQEYLSKIKYYLIIMSERYIRNHFDDIKKYENIIESRLDSYLNIEDVIKDNNDILDKAKKENIKYILIDEDYCLDIKRIIELE